MLMLQLSCLEGKLIRPRQQAEQLIGSQTIKQRYLVFWKHQNICPSQSGARLTLPKTVGRIYEAPSEAQQAGLDGAELLDSQRWVPLCTNAAHVPATGTVLLRLAVVKENADQEADHSYNNSIHCCQNKIASNLWVAVPAASVESSRIPLLLQAKSHPLSGEEEKGVGD